jgi:hypothetical protein
MAEPPWFCDWFSQNPIQNYQRLSLFCLTSRILNLDENDIESEGQFK